MEKAIKLEHFAIGLLLISVVLLSYNIWQPNEIHLVTTRQYDHDKIKEYLSLAEDQNHILFFYDFSCDYCKEMNETLNKLLANTSSDNKIYYVNSNVDQKLGDLLLALGAHCGNKQNAFLEYSKIAYNFNNFKNEETLLKKFEVNSEIILDQFDACIKSEAEREYVLKNSNLSNILKIYRVPSLAINGFIFEANIKKNVLEEIIKKVNR